MLQPTSAPAQIVADTIVRTVELGVRITDAAVAGETTVVFADLVVEGPGCCPGCGLFGTYRDTVERRVTDVPVVGHPLELRVRLPRYRCVHDGCPREVFCHDTSRLARPGATTTRRCATFVMRRLAIDKATVSAIARELGRSWDTVNTIAVEATQQLLLSAGPARLDGVRVIGVDEHQWSHVLGADADGFVTVITDLTPVVAGYGAGAAARPGSWALCSSVDRLAGRPPPGLPGPGRNRGDGRVRRLQGRRGRGAARRGHGHGPVPRGRLVRTETRPVPPAGPAGHPRAPRPLRGPALRRAARAAHPRWAAHRTAVDPHRRGVRRRRPRCGRGDLVGLPAAHRRLRRPRSHVAARPCSPP